MNFDQILEILIKEIDLKVFDENFRKEKVKVDEELLNYLELGRRCLETNEQVERGRIGLKIVVEYSWEKLNTGIWQNVAPIYRYLYAYSCYMDVLIDCRLKSGNVCSSINVILFSVVSSRKKAKICHDLENRWKMRFGNFTRRSDPREEIQRFDFFDQRTFSRGESKSASCFCVVEMKNETKQRNEFDLKRETKIEVHSSFFFLVSSTLDGDRRTSSNEKKSQTRRTFSMDADADFGSKQIDRTDRMSVTRIFLQWSHEEETSRSPYSLHRSLAGIEKMEVQTFSFSILSRRKIRLSFFFQFRIFDSDRRWPNSSHRIGKSVFRWRLDTEINEDARFRRRTLSSPGFDFRRTFLPDQSMKNVSFCFRSIFQSLRCGYLAQHPLLDQVFGQVESKYFYRFLFVQIPDLRKDIAIPDYCYLTSEENDQEQEDVDVNA